MYVDTVVNLNLITNAALGDYAFAADAKTYFCWNGTNWKPLGSANPSPPTAVAGTGAGTGSTISLAGTNTDGTISFTQGTGGIANGQIMTLTLAGGVTYATKMVPVFSAANANFASLLSMLYVTSTANTATLNFNGLALTAGQTFSGFYHIGGY